MFKFQINSTGHHYGYGSHTSFVFEDESTASWWRNESFIQSKYSTISKYEFFLLSRVVEDILNRIRENSKDRLSAFEIQAIKDMAENTRSWQEAISD